MQKFNVVVKRREIICKSEGASVREGFNRILKDEQNISGQRKRVSNPRRGTRGRKAKSGERIMIRPEFLVYLETGFF